MLSTTQLDDLRALLERSQNPVFLYDNDADGLCSYVLLRRFLDRGKGIAVRTHPDIDKGYAHKAQALGADLVVVLDCPFLGNEFVSELSEGGIPIVWIDHHSVDSSHYTHANVNVFNPTRSTSPSEEPVTYWCYRLTQRADDMWIALMGCIADHYLPSFAEEFARTCPDLWKKKISQPFEAYYDTELGKLAHAIGFGLKDSVTHVVYLQNFLISCPHPSDLFHELESGSSFARKYQDIKKRYDVLLSEAHHGTYDSVVFYRYGGTLSISADLANELSYRYMGKFVIVAYVLGSVCTMSLRGSNVRDMLETLLPSFANSKGGGHPDAVGARINSEDLDRFVDSFTKLLSKRL